MKTLLTLLAFVAVSAFGQVPDARAFYEAHRHEIIDAPALAQAQSKSPNKAIFAVPAPGDGAKFATLKLNMTFAEPGDRVVAKLIGIAQQGEFGIYGRRTVYDEKEKSTRAEFFTPTVCGSRGYCKGGFDEYQTVEVFSTQVSESDIAGLYTVDFVIYEVGTGRLRQQVFTSYYVNRIPVWGRDYFRLDGVKLAQGATGTQFVLTGGFPKDEEVVIWYGNLGEGFATYGTYKSYDGKTIVIPGGFSVGREAPIDFVMLIPNMRTSYSLAKALILPAMQNNNVAISVPSTTQP